MSVGRCQAPIPQTKAFALGSAVSGLSAPPTSKHFRVSDAATHAAILIGVQHVHVRSAFCSRNYLFDDEASLFSLNSLAGTWDGIKVVPFCVYSMLPEVSFSSSRRDSTLIDDEMTCAVPDSAVSALLDGETPSTYCDASDTFRIRH